jgi:hypothetical protein
VLTIASAQSRNGVLSDSDINGRFSENKQRMKWAIRTHPYFIFKSFDFNFIARALTIASAQSCCDAPDAPDRSDTPPAMTVWSWVSADRTCDKNTLLVWWTWAMKTTKHVSSNTIWMV